MKALSILKSAINQSSTFAVIALVLVTPLVYPHLVLAAGDQILGQSAQVFEIKITDPNLITKTLTMDEIQNTDPLVVNLMSYLQSKGSPLAPNAAEIVKYPFWQRALGISVVESNMCIHTPKVKTNSGWVESHNCSGIGGANYRIYDSYMGWFEDMNNLLGQPNYINRPIEKFINYYVQPGSASWLYGVKKTEADFAKLIQKSDTQRRETAEDAVQDPTITALATFNQSTQD